MTPFFFIALLWTFSVSVVLLRWIMEFNFRFFSSNCRCYLALPRAAGRLTIHTKRLRQYSRKCFFLAGWGRAALRGDSEELWNIESGVNRPRSKRPGGRGGEGRAFSEEPGDWVPSPSRSAELLPVADAVMWSLDSPRRTEGLISPAAGSNPRRASQCQPVQGFSLWKSAASPGKIHVQWLVSEEPGQPSPITACKN